MTDAGHVVIPIELRRAFRLEAGEEVIFSRDARSIRITPLSLAIEEAPDFFSSLAPPQIVGCIDVSSEAQAKDVMSSAVLYASALLAFIRRQPGGCAFRRSSPIP